VTVWCRWPSSSTQTRGSSRHGLLHGLHTEAVMKIKMLSLVLGLVITLPLGALRFGWRQMGKVAIARRLRHTAESMLSLCHNYPTKCGLRTQYYAPTFDTKLAQSYQTKSRFRSPAQVRTAPAQWRNSSSSQTKSSMTRSGEEIAHWIARERTTMDRAVRAALIPTKIG
jgi:hypothetical protein